MASRGRRRSPGRVAHDEAGAKAAGKPLVVITGAAGEIGSALADALSDDYRTVGLDQPGKKASIPLISADLTSDVSVGQAFKQLRDQYGARIASVIHLAAYFDFSGEESPLYESVNIEGTRRLLAALQQFEVEQFVYASTMLVHAPAAPGERIDESQPLGPKWAYPRSKLAAEEVIQREHGHIPYVMLRLAGVYGDRSVVPTLAQQIGRIYERDFQSYLYAGDPQAGQSMVHTEDMVDAFRRVVDRRRELEPETALLIGEPGAISYEELQDELGRLIHGESEWTTLSLPKPVAKAGALLQEKLEPVIPDAIDEGKKPFIRPFMIAMADDHYALDISRARRLLGWEPRSRLRAQLAQIVQALKDDPAGWYRANKITPPAWLKEAGGRGEHPEALRTRHEVGYREQHGSFLWAHFLNIALGTWLLTSPALLDLQSEAMAVSDIVAGLALIGFASLALSWRLPWARWACALIGTWVMAAPILFWAPTADGYLNDTLVGALIVALAVLTPPEPGVSPVAAVTGPTVPPGWSYNPSAWTQRVLIIALAFVGLYVSRYLAAYQLGHLDMVWEPFFEGGPDPRNGTEEIITSSVSEAWPVSDAAVGAITYLLEILTGLVGSQRRWRTMPWLVLLFGLMIAPLGVVSIFFIIIQPIWIGTWCTLCLIAAAAMLAQIPYSLDELVATTQFLARRRRAGRSLLQVFFTGDTDEGAEQSAPNEFDRSPAQIVREVVGGGVSLPWNLAAAMAIGAWLMFTRLTLGAEGATANADHLVGSLALTVAAIACAEVARPLRFLLVPLGAGLLVTPFVYGADGLQTISSVVCGLALIALSPHRGPVRERYGSWDRFLGASSVREAHARHTASLGRSG
jgi:nucleoside-diphosphate-sugar epimerase